MRVLSVRTSQLNIVVNVAFSKIGLRRISLSAQDRCQKHVTPCYWAMCNESKHRPHSSRMRTMRVRWPWNRKDWRLCCRIWPRTTWNSSNPKKATSAKAPTVKSNLQFTREPVSRSLLRKSKKRLSQAARSRRRLYVRFGSRNSWITNTSADCIRVSKTKPQFIWHWSMLQKETYFTLLGKRSISVRTLHSTSSFKSALAYTICISRDWFIEILSQRTSWSKKETLLRFVTLDGVSNPITCSKETHSVVHLNTWPLRWFRIRIIITRLIFGR